jgi:hypothetical protein
MSSLSHRFISAGGYLCVTLAGIASNIYHIDINIRMTTIGAEIN